MAAVSAMALAIEPMRLEHLSAVAEIEKQSFPTPWPVSAYRHEIEVNPNAAYFVARVRPSGADLVAGTVPGRQDIVGFAGLWLQVDEVHISTIAVHPQWRRRHIGERLLVRIIEHAEKRGMLLVTLEVRKSNLAAQQMYLKYGFVQVGLRPGYYSDTAEDALIMSTPPLDDAEWRECLERCQRVLGRL